MKKRIVALMLCGAMLVTGLAGCGKSKTTGGSEAGGSAKESTSTEEASGETKEKKDGKGVTLTFLASQDWVFDAEMQLGKQFEEETGIKVDYQIVPSDQYYNLLMTKLNSGEGPDIFGGQSGTYDIVSQYNVEKNAIDLSNEPWISSYSEFEKGQTSTGGKVYGSTYYDTTTDFYVAYNKKIYEENGLKVPTTFEEFKTNCQTLLDKGVTPFFECVGDGWHHVMWFCEIGGKYEDLVPGITEKLNNNEVKFSEVPEFKESLDQVKELADKGYFGDNYLSDEYADMPTALGTGEFAMTMCKPGTIAEIAQASGGQYTEDDFGQFLVPTLDNDVLNVHPCGPSRFIYSGSKHVDEAKQYLEYMTRKENVQHMIDNEPKIENLPYDVGQEPKYSQATQDFLASFDKQGMVFQDSVKYLNPQWFDIGKDMVAMFIDEMTSEQVLEKIDENRATQAKAAGDEAWK